MKHQVIIEFETPDATQRAGWDGITPSERDQFIVANAIQAFTDTLPDRGDDRCFVLRDAHYWQATPRWELWGEPAKTREELLLRYEDEGDWNP